MSAYLGRKMINSLKQVKDCDLFIFKLSISSFWNWYITNCDKVTDLASYFGEDDDELIPEILSSGMREVELRKELLEQGDMKRGDQL